MCVQYHAYRDAYVLDCTVPIMHLSLSLKVALRPSNVQAYIGLQQSLNALKDMQVCITSSYTLDFYIYTFADDLA